MATTPDQPRRISFRPTGAPRPADAATIASRGPRPRDYSTAAPRTQWSPTPKGYPPASGPTQLGARATDRPPAPRPVSPPAAPTDARPTEPVAPRGVAKALLWDVGLPVAAYYGARQLGASDYVALLAGTVASGARLLWVAVRDRRLDPFAGVLLMLFAAGLALSFVTGDPRFLLAKDSATTGLAGLLFLGSCLVGKPLCYLAAQRMAGPARAAELRARTAAEPALRRRWYQITLIWGGGLLAEAVLRIAVVYLAPAGTPMDTLVGASTVLQVVAIGGLIGGTYLGAKRAEARRSATARP